MHVTVGRHQPFLALARGDLFENCAVCNNSDVLVMQQPNCHSGRSEESAFAWNRENAARNRAILGSLMLSFFWISVHQ
jgi:hypothetical protein